VSNDKYLQTFGRIIVSSSSGSSYQGEPFLDLLALMLQSELCSKMLVTLIVRQSIPVVF